MRTAIIVTMSAVIMTIFSQCGSTGTVYPGKEWRTSTPSEQGLDEAKFIEAVSWLDNAFKEDRDGISQLFIVRNGYAIHAGDSVRKVHNVFSCTKSFTSLTLGLLADDGKCALSTPPKTAAIQGNKNNYCFVIPEWNMVIVRLGEHKILDAAWNGFFEKLSKAIVN